MVWTWTTRDTFFSQHFIEDLIHTARKGHNGINRTHTGHLLLIGFLTLASPFLQRSSRLIFGQGHALTIGGGHNQFVFFPLGRNLILAERFNPTRDLDRNPFQCPNGQVQPQNLIQNLTGFPKGFVAGKGQPPILPACACCRTHADRQQIRILPLWKVQRTIEGHLLIWTFTIDISSNLHLSDLPVRCPALQTGNRQIRPGVNPSRAQQNLPIPQRQGTSYITLTFLPVRCTQTGLLEKIDQQAPPQRQQPTQQTIFHPVDGFLICCGFFYVFDQAGEFISGLQQGQFAIFHLGPPSLVDTFLSFFYIPRNVRPFLFQRK